MNTATEIARNVTKEMDGMNPHITELLMAIVSK
jgi:hypothetical protein